jgi:hypothetical protein
MRANWIFLTPSLARSSLGPADMPSIKTVLSAGEAIGQDNVSKWSTAVKYILGYGPSETT